MAENTARVVMIGDHRFFLPFIDLIPFNREQDEELGKAINDAGRVYVPIICWKEKKTAGSDTVVDGAHRVVWAAKFGLPAPKVLYESFADEEEARLHCQEINVERRHLMDHQLAPLHLERIARVAARRAKGESLRTIAEKEKVSQSQVRRDLSEAGESAHESPDSAPGAPPPGAPEPESEKIQGKDGKTYPATGPKKQPSDTTSVLCKRCKRLSPRADCQECERLRKKVENKRKKKKASAAPTGDKDAFGNDLPKRCRDAFCDPWLRTTFDFLCTISEKVRLERIIDGMGKRAKHYPFLKAKDVTDGVGFIIQYLDQLIEHIKTNRPAGVCPSCEGKGCADCRSSGLVPREVYKTLKEAAK